MNDEQKPSADDEKRPAETEADHQETVEQPAAEVATAPPAPDAATTSEQAAVPGQGKLLSTPRTRNTLIASGAGLALAGGLVGFGIGHASADDGSGDRFRPTSQYVPGEGRPDFRDGERPDGAPGGFGDRDQSGDGGTDDQQSNGVSDPT